MREFRLRVGSALKRLREQQGLTLARLAPLSGIEELELNRMEERPTDFPVDNLFRLGRVLHFVPSDLINRCKKRPPVPDRASGRKCMEMVEAEASWPELGILRRHASGDARV